MSSLPIATNVLTIGTDMQHQVLKLRPLLILPRYRRRENITPMTQRGEKACCTQEKLKEMTELNERQWQ
jgi:hypothetical protein